MLRASRIFALALAIVLTAISAPTAQSLPFALFERYLEQFRPQAGVPGMSAAIVQDGHIVWERGLGQRDVENSLPVMPDTPFYLADLTQVLSAALVLECSDRNEVNLDEPIGTWVPGAPNPQASVRQVLSHTSTGDFRYDPSRFALLAAPIEQCFNRPLRRAMTDELLEFLAMQDAAPGRDVTTPAVRQEFDADALEKFADTLSRMAVPYRVDRRGRARSDVVLDGFDPSRGLIASARDLVEFDRALEADLLMDRATRELAWSNVTVRGRAAPAGLGWFAQQYGDVRLIWYYGYTPNAASSLILKIPARRLTLILLANSDGLSESFDLHNGDVTSSLFANAFLRFFL